MARTYERGVSFRVWCAGNGRRGDNCGSSDWGGGFLGGFSHRVRAVQFKFISLQAGKRTTAVVVNSWGNTAHQPFKSYGRAKGGPPAVVKRGKCD